MKKILFAFIVIMTAFMILVPLSVSADESVPEPEAVETAEPVETTEPTLDEFKQEVSDWLSQYMEESMVVKIVTWLVDAGVLTALFAVYLKYRKYKHTTIEDLTKQFGDKVGVWLKENFDRLSEEQIKDIINTIDELEKSNETIMKVLVLMQDNTPKGKAALIEFLGSKTESKEVKKAVEEVNEKLEEQEKINTEVKEKVKGDYEDIF